MATCRRAFLALGGSVRLELVKGPSVITGVRRVRHGERCPGAGTNSVTPTQLTENDKDCYGPESIQVRIR